MKKIVLKLIRAYQAAKPFRVMIGKLFFLPEATCRFRPTCSDYTYTAVKKYGIVRGLALGTKRFLRCNPFSKGGYDPVK